jgi:Ca2+-binding EF-hand superfamily protein
MRKIIPHLLASALAAVCTFAIAADPATSTSTTTTNTTNPGAARAARRAEMQQRFFDKIDTNHDGVISRAEYQAWVDARFARLDPNGTDSVTAADVAASPAATERAQKKSDGFIKRYDTSGTGAVTKAEFEAKEMAHFDRMSGGADTVTQEQFTAAFAAQRGRFMQGRGAPSKASGTTTPDGTGGN